jgi:2-oxoglutarate dehydrogenase E2 component (dihydrolipoamide succinyltransferase)
VFRSDIVKVQLTRMRARIAERLKEAQNTMAMLTTFNECDMSNLMAMRDAGKDEFNEKHGVKLGFMSAFVKASAIALQEQPVVNAGPTFLFVMTCESF